MAKWYDEWLTPTEQKTLQVGQKGIRARQRKATHEKNVETAQKNMLEREKASGQAYADKMQSDTDRSKKILKNAFVQKTYGDSKRTKK